jgi:hypothetical protein
MATAVTPFGESFGDPRRYMGQSPLAQIGQALKTGGILYGLQKSGAIDALDRMGIKSNAQGGFGYQMPTPAGSVPPITSGPGGVNADGVFGTNPMPISPSSLSQPVMPTITPFGQEAPSNVQMNTLPPPDAGRQILEGTFRPQSSVDVRNPTDFSPLAPDASNQFAVSGNDYQQIPGYGKLQRIAGQFMGMG